MSSGMSTYTCRECGETEEGRWTEPKATQLHETQLCFSCDHWTEMHAWQQAGDRTPAGNPVIRINGHHYVFYPFVTNPRFGGAGLGFGGRKQTAILTDGTTLTSNNVWHQGRIPATWADRLPDNATWQPQPNPLEGLAL